MRKYYFPIALLATSILSPGRAQELSEDQLAEALRRFPAADANHDGKLTNEEAHAFLAARRARAANTSVSAGDNRPAPTFSNVAYGPDALNKFDFWQPKAPARSPLIVFIHGGGFVGGDKRGIDLKILQACQENGVAYMSINYRFRPETAIQDILRDCARAIQFVRAHADEYKIDPARVVSYGGSAGAGASLWLDFHPDLADPKNPDPVLRESSRILGAGALNTQSTYDLLEWEQKIGKFQPGWAVPGETASFYHLQTEAELQTPAGKKILDDVSMLRLITKDDPPVFLFTAGADIPPRNRGELLHHPDHARAVKKRCDEVGVPATISFAQAEPRVVGDSRDNLRTFLFERLGVKVPTASAR